VRRLAERYGAARIRAALRAKGVHAALADRLEVQDELARARAILARRFPQPPANASERLQRARFLERRGFAHEVIRRLVGELRGDDPA